MASYYSTSLVFFCSILLVVWCSLAKTSPRPILQVTKDAKTLQYVAQVFQRTPLVPVNLSIDLGGPFMWVNCERSYTSSSFRPVFCETPPCALLNSIACATECLNPPSFECMNNTCAHFPVNPFGNIGTSELVFGDVLAVKSTNGRNVLPVVTVPRFYFVCGSNILDVGLASGVSGVAGLGRQEGSLPGQLSSYFKFHRIFALCLSSSTTSSGAVFFGNGPYMLRPNVDVSSSLSYTPLITNNITASPEYYIGVKSIKVNDQRVKFKESLLSFNIYGQGGTSISTASPYTVLETSIYSALVAAFVKAMPKNVQKVPNVAPFGACFNSKNIGSTRLGPTVPSIDLVLQSKNVWRIKGANSMVKVNEDVLCLGFVEARTDITPLIPVIIGGHQIENNLLKFDLVKARLGFSSSLLGRSTTCANFNFA